jgi:hypothetical protein
VSYLTHTRKLAGFLVTNGRLMALSVGSLLVIIWTIARTLAPPATFDLYGQQVLTHQWLHGFHDYALIGITHYLLKMGLLYAPLDILPGDPRLKLLLLTAGVNLVTFIVIFVLLEKILQLFKLRPGLIFYVAMVWSASISGSIYWIQYTNSRNLEVAGGVLLIFLSLKYWLHPYRRLLMGLGIVATILLFSDTLQTYMTLLPLIVFLLWRRLQGEGSWKLFRYIAIILAAGFGESLQSWPSAAVGTVKWFAVLFSGGVEFARPLQALNMALAGLLLCLALVYWCQSARHRTVLGLCLMVVAVNTSVYFLSGQSLVAGTSRYLVMTMPMVLLASAVVAASASHTVRQMIAMGFVGLSLLNGIMVAHVLQDTSGKTFPSDRHLQAVHNYLQKHHYRTAFTSLDTAVPATYLLGDHPALLPLSCEAGTLSPRYLFYDQAVSKHTIFKAHEITPLILDGDAIANYPIRCTETTATKQLGAPIKIEKLEDGSQVMLYDSQALKSSFIK